PFMHTITIKNPDSTNSVQIQALFNDGTMTGAMCLSVFSKIRHSLQGWQPSMQMLHMANGTVVLSEAMWSGMIQVNRVEAKGTFEVFNSGGGWSFLFGKPLLQAFKAKHDYTTDKVMI
ncbi:hypothetical protein M404DRAFT_106983, partial [Pisolithus tinctorius Marx 270]